MSSSLPTGTVPVKARWVIRIRRADYSLADQLTSWQKFSIAKRFNNVSDWVLQLDAADPLAQLLETPKYGIQAIRSLYNANTGALIGVTTEIAGPMLDFTRAAQGNALVFHGQDDMVSIADHIAYPVTGYPFYTDMLALNPVLYWRMNATSGTSETDRSGNNNTGTYHGTAGTDYILDQTGILDDPSPSVKFVSGAGTGYLLQSGTKTPTTVTGSFTVFGVVANGSSGYICGSRSGGDHSFDLIVKGSSSPYIHCDIGDGTNWMTTAADVTTNPWPTTPMWVVCTVVTPTSWTHYVNGIQAGTGTFASATPMLWDSTRNLAAAWNSRGTDLTLGGNLQEFAVFNSALTAAQVLQISTEAVTRFAKASYDSATGNGETVIRGYVDRNVGASAAAERIVTALTQSTNAGAGSTVTGNARFDYLIATDGTGLLQLLAIAAGGLGFRTVPTPGSLGIQFQVYQPTDRSASVRFSSDLGSVVDYTYTLAGPKQANGGNVVIVAGGGTLTARSAAIIPSASSIATWRRVESFLDARDTTDYATMQQRATAALAQGAQATTFNSTLSQTQGATYGIDFFLGDKVTTVVDGITFASNVSEVDITLDSQNAELVTPYVGTPNAQVVLNALVQMRHKTQQLESRIAKLERRA